MLHKINISNLENLVLKRFWNHEELQELLDELLGSEGTVLNESWKNDKEDNHDYLLVGTVYNETHDENNNIRRIEHYDVDIYYAKSKNHCIVTEVNWEEV